MIKIMINMNKIFLLTCLLLSMAFSQVAKAQITSNEGESRELATFAGGCFWCLEPPFDKLDGVIKTESGFSNGRVKNPTYKQVSKGGTGHVEVVQVTYDPSKVSYDELLEVFWVNHDPLDLGGQFCDRGETYRPAIFVHNEQQRHLAQTSKERLNTSSRLPRKALTPIEDFQSFYAAETYHQNYYQKNPLRYKWYRGGCGRDKHLEQLWSEKG